MLLVFWVRYNRNHTWDYCGDDAALDSIKESRHLAGISDRFTSNTVCAILSLHIRARRAAIEDIIHHKYGTVAARQKQWQSQHVDIDRGIFGGLYVVYAG